MLTEISLARKTIIKMATLAPEGTPWHALIAKMGERWTEETNGNVRLRIYPGGIVGDERDMIRKMKIGQILITPDDTEQRRRALNARRTFENLFKLGAIPVVNENDTTATSEIK